VLEDGWRQKLNGILTKLNPAAFERLAQRMLRELGFTQVEVTGRSGDGGIDGRGIARVNGVMSFHVLFQCKRFKGWWVQVRSGISEARWWGVRTRDYS